MWEFIVRVLLGLFLMVVAIKDLISKKISLWIVILCIILLSICIPFCKALTLLDKILGISLGLGVLILSKITEGKIGMGDGLVLSVTGMGLGFWSNLELFALALAFAALFSMFLLVFRLAGRKNSIPFLPFMFISYLFLCIPVWSEII